MEAFPIILYLFKEECMCGDGCSSFATVFSFDGSTKPLQGHAPLPHFQQGADNSPNHVAQKPVGLDVKHQHAILFKPTSLHDFAVVGLDLRMDFGKTRKILIVIQEIRCLLHFFKIEVAVKEKGIVGMEGILRACNIIMIGARKGVKTGVSFGSDLPYMINHDVSGKEGIQLMNKRFRFGDFLFKVEMGIIVPCMDSCVGASATRDGNRLSQLEAQALFHGLLHTFGVRLDLVAVIATAVIGHVNEIAWHCVAKLRIFAHHFKNMYRLIRLNDDDYFFPPADHANSDGLVAFGGDLSPHRLIMAYANGIFPWYSEDEPILWWSLDPRLVIRPGEMKVSKSLRHTIKSGKFECRIDTNFREVMLHCAQTPRPDQDGTWILDEMVEAYCHLHELGFTHSFETYLDGELVGGLYGVSIGKVFFGESMFHTVTDASKVAFWNLHQFLQQHGFQLIDCQQETSHLMSLGAYAIPRSDFIKELKVLTMEPTLVGNWGTGQWEEMYLNIKMPDTLHFQLYDFDND